MKLPFQQGEASVSSAIVSPSRRVHLPFEPPFGKPPELDAFGSEDLAGRLANLVNGVRPPYAISISGEWGIGKTTLMHQMLSAMRQLDGKPLTVELDLWSEDIDDLRRAIAIEVGAVTDIGTDGLVADREKAAVARQKVAGDLDREIRGTVSRPELSSDFKGNLTRPFAWRTALAVGLAVVALFWLSANASKPWDALALSVIPAVFTGALIITGLALGVTTTSRSIAPAAERVGLGRELRRLVSTQRDPRTVFVVIDNLDRLSGEDALKTLAEIRTFIEIPDGRCVFVIPIDRDAFVRHCLSQDMDSDVAHDYLEKFFNLNVLLTKPAPLDLRSWTLGMVVDCAGAGDDRGQVAEIIADAADGSPRSVMRILSGTMARDLLLGDEPGTSITLPQIAFLEALVTEFPFVLQQIGGAPRVLIEARRGLSAAMTIEKQTAALIDLVGKTQEQTWQPEWNRLRSFLLTHRAISVDVDEVALILSLRQDRDWRDIDRPADLRSAMRTGDAVAFGTDLESRDADARGKALARATDLVAHDCRSGWITGAINGLNALVSWLPPGAPVDDLRDDARQVLAGAHQQVAAVSVDTVRFACGDHPDDDPRLLEAVDWAASMIRGRADGPVVDPASCLELLKLMSLRIRPDQLDNVRSSLVTRTAEELSPLFVPGDHIRPLLTGPVTQREIDFAISWDVAADNQIAQMGPCLDRLALVRDYGLGLDETHLGILLPKLYSGMATATINWLGCFDKLVQLLANQPASGPIDNLAIAWSTWPASLGDGLRVALALPTQAPMSAQLQQTAAAWMLTAADDEVASFARGVRDQFGSLVSATLAQRWVNTRDGRVADLAAEGGGEAIATLVAQLDSVPPPSGPYLPLVQQIVEVILSRRSAAGAALLVDAIVRYLDTAASANIAGFAPILGRLGELEVDRKPVVVDVDPVISSVEMKLKRATEADLPALAATAKEFDGQRLDPAGRLAAALITRSRELQSIDWETIEWLASRHSKKTEVVEALVSAFERGAEPIQETIPRLSRLRKPLHGSPHITEAVVVAVASCPDDQVEGLLQQLRDWNRPKRPGDSYKEALRKIGLNNPGLLHRVEF